MADEQLQDASAPANEGVTVSTNRFQDARLRGMTPLQAGLLYGGAASTVMGPLGALVGLGVGLYTKINRDNVIDHRAKSVNDVVAETTGLQNLADQMRSSGNVDDATQKFIDMQVRLGQEGLTQYINEADPMGRVKMQNANTALAGVLSAQMEQARTSAMAQETAKRGLVTSSAETYRNQFQTNQDNWRDINTQADKILALTSEKGFDPTKPINVGLITGMLSRGVDVYNSNPNDYANAISQGLSGLDKMGGKAGGIVAAGASVVSGVVNYFKGKEIAPTTEDYVRLAMNMKNYAAKDAQMKMDQLSQQGQALDAQARKWGVFSQDTDLAGYITGSVKKLPVTPTPEMPAAPTAAQLLPSTTAAPSQQPRPNGVQPNGQPSPRLADRWNPSTPSARQSMVQQNMQQNGQSILQQGLSEGAPRPVN